MFNDINVDKRGSDTSCTLTSVKIQEYATRFVEGRWAFLGRGEGEKWFRGYDYKPEGRWDSVASEMVQNFKNLGHPVIKGTSALNRGFMRKKKDKDTIHYNGESSNVELLYRILHSANQLCVHGAVTKWCERTESEKKWALIESETLKRAENKRWRNQFFGETHHGHQQLRETGCVKNFKVLSDSQTHLWKSRILSSSGEESVISDSSWRGWIGKDHPNVQRIHSSS